MSPRFAFDVTPAATGLRLLQAGEQAIPVDLWAVRAPASLLRGVDLVRSLEGIDKAVVVDDTVLIEHAVVAGLSAADAALLGFPPPADAIARVQSTGLITRPDYKITLSWVRPTGQAIASAERTGAWLRVAGSWHRLPEPLFGIAEAIDALAALAPNDVGGRMVALARLRDVLPSSGADAAVMVEGALGTMTIAVAGAFSLDLAGKGVKARLVPILHKDGAADDTPLLPEEQQHTFANERFYTFSEARDVYQVAPGSYVVLTPALQQALSVVRRAHAAPLTTRRRLMESPRAFLREVLGDDADSVVVDRVFRETARYADRVIGLGLWQPRVLPWVSIASTDWFGPEHGATAVAPVRDGGLVVGDQRVALTPDEAQELATRVEAAIARDEPTVLLQAGAESVQVPATADTLRALRDLTAARSAGPQRQEVRLPPTVLLIAPNEEQVEIVGEFRRRGELPLGLPRALRTPLKRHQREGLEWLQRSYLAGRPGVLLADDMGLGKTLQGLTFLCWLREAMTAGRRPRAPLLVVAPTGLLETWRAEHDRHLDAPGLGRCLRAFGRDLAAIRSRDADGRPSLDRSALRDADWVLTTFETLRDYDRDFGAVPFAIMLMDEAQKIKTPGIRLTDAAKAMNAEFRIAMTGTPVENRLADLWCIVDAVHPACLDDLKTFSARYERAADPAALKALKARLDRPRGATPPAAAAPTVAGPPARLAGRS